VAQFGITSVQVMPGMPVDEFATLLKEADVTLRVRIIHFPTAADERLPAKAPRQRGQPSGIKWVLDGTPVERGAAQRAGYADRPATRGELNFSPAFVRTALGDAAARGEQSLFHCAGDRCAETVLAAMESMGDVDWAAARLRIEHGDGVLEDLMPRAARLGVVVVQNPTHFTIGELLVERFGARHRYQPLRSLLQAGVRLALGSDGPMNPFLNILLASTHPARPEEALTREQALDAYTRGSAFAEHAEREKGTLAPGQLADLAILSQDIFQVPVDALPATHSVLTLVGGQIVHDSGLLERR
jgi:predicted amidohydrolase YtcJ